MMNYSWTTLFYLIISVLMITSAGCAKKKNQLHKPNNMDADSLMIDKEEAKRIAHEDAKKIYKDFSIYDIKAELKNDKWYVDYEINIKNMLGGGPHYVISAETGKILSYRYEQ